MEISGLRSLLRIERVYTLSPCRREPEASSKPARPAQSFMELLKTKVLSLFRYKKEW